MQAVAERKPVSQPGRSVRAALALLGVSCHHDSKHRFWSRPDLDYLLSDARAAWKARIKQAHPDKGGSTALAAELNLAWAYILRSFAEHGITFDGSPPRQVRPQAEHPPRQRRSYQPKPLRLCACGCGQFLHVRAKHSVHYRGGHAPKVKRPYSDRLKARIQFHQARIQFLQDQLALHQAA